MELSEDITLRLAVKSAGYMVCLSSDHSLRNGAGPLLFSDSELTIIIISSVLVSGSHSVQAATCLTCLWCDKAALSGRTKCWGLGSLGVCRLYLHTISSNGSDDMFFLNWPCLSSFAAGVAHGPWSWGLSILGGHLEPDTLSPQSSLSPDTAINCWLLARSHGNLLEWRQARQLSGPQHQISWLVF